MATKVCNAIVVAMDSGDFYFVLRILAKGCLTYKYQVYQWDAEKGTLTFMARKANKIMKEMLCENDIPYPQVALGDRKNSSTAQTGNILWEHLHQGVHWHLFNPKVTTVIGAVPRLFSMYEDGRRYNRGKKKE